MVLLHYIIKVFDLPDDDGGAVFLVVALDGGFIGVTAVNGDLLGNPMTADGFLQKPECGLFIAVLLSRKSMVWPCLSTAEIHS